MMITLKAIVFIVSASNHMPLTATDLTPAETISTWTVALFVTPT